MVGSVLILLLAISAVVQNSLLKNQDFSDGLNGWTVHGEVRADHGLVLGPRGGTVSQQYTVPGLRILYFGAHVQGAPVRLRLKCLDRRGHTVLNLESSPDAKGDAGIYLKTQATTESVEVSFERDAASGTATVTGIRFEDDDRSRVEHRPQLDLGVAMRPIWEDNRTENESLLLLDDGSGRPAGKLLFTPTRILAVHDSSLATTYAEGRDFEVKGREVMALPGSHIPTMSVKEFATGEYPWTRLDGRHVFVTYEHSDSWTGPLPKFAGDQLPRTVGLLQRKKPVKIVAYGDSITLGINVSGFRNLPPFQPPWPTLVQEQLKNSFKNRSVHMVNTALGGMTSQWGKDNAVPIVGALKPDLVLVAFGMNDFWSLTPDLFAANIRAIMSEVRAVAPDAEFLLVAPMKFDPDYTREEPYVSNLTGYAGALAKLRGPGIAVLDMTATTDYLYREKGAKSLTTDPMHPDDFLARIYAQSVVRMLTPTP